VTLADSAKKATAWERYARAKRKFKPIRRTRVAQRQSFTYKYADLEEILGAVEPALDEEGFLITSSCSDGSLVCHLVDVYEGNPDFRVTAVPLVIPPGAGPQELGAAITYHRRYAVSLLLNLVPEDDDDAQSAQDLVREPVEDDGPPQPYRACPECGGPMYRSQGVNAKTGKAWVRWTCRENRSHPVQWGD